jgi:hypothetical protein
MRGMLARFKHDTQYAFEAVQSFSTATFYGGHLMSVSRQLQKCVSEETGPGSMATDYRSC